MCSIIRSVTLYEKILSSVNGSHGSPLRVQNEQFWKENRWFRICGSDEMYTVLYVFKGFIVRNIAN